MFELTPLARNVSGVLVFVSVYSFLGFLTNAALNFFLLLCLAMYAAWTNAVNEYPPNRMDGVAAGARNEALKPPPGEKSLSQAVVSMAMFADEGPSPEYLFNMAQTLLQYRRFSCRLVKKSPWWNSQWVPVEGLVPDDMIQDETLPEDGPTIHERLEDIVNMDWEPGQPAWKIHMVRSPKENSSVIAVRVAHWIGDGMRLVQAFSPLMSDETGAPLKPPTIGKSTSKLKLKQRKKKKGIPLYRRIMNIPMDLKYILEVSNGPSDAMTPFKTVKLSFPERCQLYMLKDPIDFEQIRAIKDKYSVSVNDVLTAAFAGSLRKFILENQPSFFNTQREPLCRALLPVAGPSSVPFEGQKDYMHNNFGFLSSKFPIHLQDFKARCLFVQKDVNQIKYSFRGAMGIFFPRLLGLLGLDTLARQSALDGWGNHSFIFSNVPGWNFPGFMDGHEMVLTMGAFKNCIPQVILMSYNGRISASMTCDASKFQGDPQNILDEFANEIEEAYRAAL